MYKIRNEFTNKWLLRLLREETKQAKGTLHCVPQDTFCCLGDALDLAEIPNKMVGGKFYRVSMYKYGDVEETTRLPGKFVEDFLDLPLHTPGSQEEDSLVTKSLGHSFTFEGKEILVYPATLNDYKLRKSIIGTILWATLGVTEPTLFQEKIRRIYVTEYSLDTNPPMEKVKKLEKALLPEVEQVISIIKTEVYLTSI